MAPKNEELYDSLQKAVTNSAWVIKWLIYPITVVFALLTGVGIWYGVSISSAKSVGAIGGGHWGQTFLFGSAEKPLVIPIGAIKNKGV